MPLLPMHMLRNGLLIGALASMVPHAASALPTGAQTRPMPSSAPDSLSADARMLREQVAILREDSDRILSTALWSLGLSAAFVLGSLGLLGFLNYRFAARETEALKTELHGSIATELAKLHEQMRQASLSLGKKTSEAVVAAEKRLQADVAKRIDALREDLHTVELDFLRYEVDQETKKPSGHALYKAVELAQKALKYRHDWIVDKALEDIEKLLPFLSKYDFEGIYEHSTVALLQQLGDKHALSRERIFAFLRDRGTGQVHDSGQKGDDALKKLNASNGFSAQFNGCVFQAEIKQASGKLSFPQPSVKSIAEFIEVFL